MADSFYLLFEMNGFPDKAKWDAGEQQYADNYRVVDVKAPAMNYPSANWRNQNACDADGKADH